MTGVVSPHPRSQFPFQGMSYLSSNDEGKPSLAVLDTSSSSSSSSSTNGLTTSSSLPTFSSSKAKPITNTNTNTNTTTTTTSSSFSSYCTPSPDGRRSFHLPNHLLSTTTSRRSDSPTACVSNEEEEEEEYDDDDFNTWGNELWVGKTSHTHSSPCCCCDSDGSPASKQQPPEAAAAVTGLRGGKSTTAPLKFQQQVRRQLRRIRYRERRAQHIACQNPCHPHPHPHPHCQQQQQQPGVGKNAHHVHYNKPTTENNDCCTVVAPVSDPSILTSVSTAPATLCLGLPLAQDSIPACWEDLHEEETTPFPCWECQAHTTTQEVGGQLKYEECEIFQAVEQALKNGGSVKLADEGVGGTYIIRDVDRNPIAIFKPADEEAGVPQNPHGHTGGGAGGGNANIAAFSLSLSDLYEGPISSTPTKGMTYPISLLPIFPPLSVVGGICPGTCWVREIAAYLLDHHHFSGVPETTYAMIPASWGIFATNKFGSLQRYVTQPAYGGGNGGGSSGNHTSSYSVIASSDVTPGNFCKEDVHRIGILDIRLCNCDRHGGNILALRPNNLEAAVNTRPCPPTTTTTTRLVPIDHGYVLPVSLEDLDFEWLWWPQSNQPFSEETAEQVKAINPDKDVVILRSLGIEEKAIQLMKAATLILQFGVRRGYTLRQIACLLRRPTLSDASEAEKLLDKVSSGDSVEEVDWASFEASLLSIGDGDESNSQEGIRKERFGEEEGDGDDEEDEEELVTSD